MSKKYKVEATWLKGTQIESKTREFKLMMDKPLEENGTNLAPKPAEVALQALGSCLLFAYLYAANKLNKTINGLKVHIEGEVIPGGWEDDQNTKRAGFKTVEFNVIVDSHHSEKEIQEVHHLALRASPMYDNFTHPVDVKGSFTIK